MKMFYDAAPNGASGGTPLSLADLDNLESVQSGDGTQKLPDISQVSVEPTTEPTTKPDEPEVTPKPEEPNDVVTDEPSPDEVTQVDDFYKQVSQITGENVEVDFGETDPLSPEGVALRDKAIRQDAVQKFEDYLKTTDPRAYAYMLHREAGGNDDDFFAQKTFVLPNRDEFELSIDAQTDILKRDLLGKGVPLDIVDASIAKYIKDNTLSEKAGAAYDTMWKAQEQQMQQIEQAQMEQRQQLESRIASVTNMISKGITEGALNFIIPESKKVAFNDYIKQNLRYDSGKFYVVNEVKDDVKELLESQYFQFVKGDLSALIKKEAKTQTTQRLRTVVNKANNNSLKSDAHNISKDYVPLGHL